MQLFLSRLLVFVEYEPSYRRLDRTCVNRPFYRQFRSLSRDGLVTARVANERADAVPSIETCSIPTLASNPKLQCCNGLQIPEEASASESASEIITGIPLNHYSGIIRQPLVKTGFAAHLV